MQAAKRGRLFCPLNCQRNADRKNLTYTRVGNKLPEWGRGLDVTGEKVVPNHGWRYRFKTVRRKSKIDRPILEAIHNDTPVPKAAVVVGCCMIRQGCCQSVYCLNVPIQRGRVQRYDGWSFLMCCEFGLNLEPLSLEFRDAVTCIILSNGLLNDQVDVALAFAFDPATATFSSRMRKEQKIADHKPDVRFAGVIRRLR
jgi:hypothetical protein